MRKRGISPLIGSVLLIAFVIILFVSITMWVRQSAINPAMESGEGKVASDIETIGTRVKLENYEVIGDTIKLTVTNIGDNTIEGFSVRIVGSNGIDILEVKEELNELDTITKELEFDLIKTGTVEKVEVYPILGSGIAIGAGSGSEGIFVDISSCFTILQESSNSESGVYYIDPDGEGGNDPFEVYCDMETDGGGWTRIDYSEDLLHLNRWTSGDAWKWVDNDFMTVLSKEQIEAMQSVSTEGKQRYDGSCQGVLHYYYNSGANYAYAFGFRFLNGNEVGGGRQDMGGIDFTMIEDGCKANDGTFRHTIWDINDVRVPIVNVKSRDNGNSGERFGSELTQNPAWLR